MEKLTENEKLRLKTLWDISQADPEYKIMLEENRELERRYELVLRGLSPEDQDAVCDFVSQCEAMSWRILEIAAQKMIFRFEKE